MFSNGTRKLKNHKLETFLKLNLQSSVYEDIRWYEPVIVRKGASLSYKQVVVTGEDVLAVDTPMKGVASLLNINTIAAVLLVHDLPQFLEGGLRDRTTHILLKIRNDECKYDRSYSTASTRRLSDQSVISEDDRENDSCTHQPEFDKSKDQLDKLKNINKEDLNATKQDNSRNTGKKGYLYTRQSSTELLSFTANEDKNKAKVVKVPKRSRPPLLRSLGVEGEKKQHGDTYSLLSESRHSIGDISFHSPILGPTSSPFVYGAVERPISPALTELITRVDGASLRLDTRSSTPDIYLSSRQIMPRSFSALENYNESPHFPAQNNSFRCRSVLDKPSGLYSLPFPKKTTNLSDVPIDENAVEEEDELHIYSLSTSTYLYHLLHSLWMASLLIPEKSLSVVPNSNNCLNLDEEEFKKTFKDVYKELKKSTSLSKTFNPIQDLKQGARSYSSVRRLFWKDKECLSAIRNLLSDLVPASKTSTSFNEEYLEQRESELALMILANEVLDNVLARSQGCPHKAKVFKSKQLVEKLLQEVFTPPELSSNHKFTCNRFLTDFKELSTMTWELLPEKEIISLTQKVTDSSVRVAFHIIEAIFEIGWNASSKKGRHSQLEADSMTLHILMQHVQTEQWLSLAIPQLFFLIHVKPRNCDEVLATSEVILIYQYFGVFLALFKQNPRALAYCIQKFSEEIRYYICESTLKRRIDPSNHLRSHTLRMAQSISKLFSRTNTKNHKNGSDKIKFTT